MEISIASFIHIINLILKKLKITIPQNMLLVQIREQAFDFFVVADLRVEELRFWKPFKKANKCSDIVSRIYFKIPSQIVDLYLTVFPNERYISRLTS